MKVLAIIPARGDSKSIPLKNIQKLGRYPLITHTIEAAKNSKEINRIIVSTDNKKIARTARKYGAEIPFLRPKKFSRDNSSTLEVILHATHFLKNTENYVPDIITILQPTNPIRPVNLIDNSIRLLKNSNATSVLGVFKIRTHPYRAFLPDNGFLKPFKRDFLKYYQKQKHPLCYYPSGSVYTFWYTTLEKYGNYYGPRIKPLISKKNEENIDIDSLFDLFIAEMKIKFWNKYEKCFKKRVKTH